MNYQISNFTSTFSLSTTPRLSVTRKTVWFRVCVTYRDSSNIKFIDIYEDNTLEQLKQEINKELDLKTNPTDFTLTVLDEDKRVWKPISEDNLHNTIGSLSFASHSFLNVEKSEERNTSQQYGSASKEIKLTLKLCKRPMDKSSCIPLTTYSSTTLSELKEQAEKHVTNQTTDHLFLWGTDKWTKFETALGDVSLAQLEFIDNSFISFTANNDPIPGVCGLTNLGNTCFMNSALQCLSHIPELTRHILSSDDKMNGPIIGAYFELIKDLWSGEHVIITPSSLLLNICENLPSFTRYRQHDAQEFMNYFLHLIHQELTNERTLITDLFYGRIQSSVKCLGGCNSIEINEESISFLPLPIENDINLYNLLYLRSNGEHHFVSVRVSAKTIGALMKSFIEQYQAKLSSKHIEAVRIVENNIKEKYSPYTWLSDVMKHQLTFIELPEKTHEQKYIEFQFLNRETYKPFRPPIFLVRPLIGCRYSDLSEQIDQVQNHLCSVTSAPHTACHLYWINTYDEMRDLNAEKTKDEVMPLMNRLIIEMDSEWVKKYTNCYNFERLPSNASLDNLLADFFREEPLDGDYYCSKCLGLKEAKQKADLALPLPRVLIVQLKRFTYDVHSDAKIETYIDFPIRNLDLAQYIAQNDRKNGNISASYDLVAVSNHRGTLISGHYTTYARNYRNKKWYSFNDEITREISDEKDIVTKNAYILVYVKRIVS